MGAPTPRSGTGAHGTGTGAPVEQSVDQSWLGVEARHLAAFEAVARERSFGRAARQLGYTQSAVSGLIAALERLVGERLLDRNRGSGHVELTPAGQVLLSHASVITARIQAARADIAGLDAQDVARLRVGIHQSVGVSLVPMLVSASAVDLPGVDLVLQEAGSERNLQQLVAEGDLDLAFSVAPVRPESLASTVLLRDCFVLLRPRTAASETIELGDRPLAAFEPCTSQRAVEERLEEHGLAPTLVIRLEDAATIHALVEGGVANALLPRLAVLESDVDLRPLPDLPRRTVVLVWQRDRTLPPEAQRFIELAAQTAAELAEDT
jgi:DNA-binding transcriptional LysR family regulator